MMETNWIEQELAELREQDMERKLVEHDQGLLNFSSNDYLALSNNPALINSGRDLLEKLGAGAGASRLVSGTLACHARLELRLAELKGYPASLLYGSGYLANIGIIPVLAGRDDHVFVDRLAHASIIDAAILSRAKLHRFEHNDCSDLERKMAACPETGRRLVVTESVFSMDGDLASLPEIVKIAKSYGAMVMVDEAHATGLFGPGGAGLIRAHGLEGDVDVSMGTLGKALGCYGGFVACSERIKALLVNRSRSFIYTTALPPAIVGAVTGALDLLCDDPCIGNSVLEKAECFRSQLREAGLDTGPSASQIIPVIVGASAVALSFAAALRDAGLLAVAIRPPTVPEGTARLRFSVNAGHSRQDLLKAAAIIIDQAKQAGLL